MLKDEFWIQTFLTTLGGLVSNPSNVKATTSDLVEQSINTAQYASNRVTQVISAWNPAFYGTAAATATTAAITYTATATSLLNQTPEVVRSSTNPTSVKQPDTGDSIASKSMP